MGAWKADVLRFGTLGIAIFALVLWIQLSWLRIAASLMGRERIVFDQQPPWIHVLASAVGIIPWLVGAALLVVALRRRRWVPFLAFAGSQILGMTVVLGVLFGAPVVRDHASRRPFDSAAWKAENREGAEGMRVRMVDDLLRRHPLVGMPCAQLEDRLGVPPPTVAFGNYDYVYWLGPERGAFSIDSEWLVVRCGPAGVTSAAVVTD